MFVELCNNSRCMKIHSFLMSVLMVLVLTACSGSRKASNVAGNSSAQGVAPSSRSTGNDSSSGSIFGGSGSNSTKKGNSKAYQRTHADLVKEAEERREEVAKRKEKEAKMAEKPQYSDPSYFGHKKKPKKRPVGKRKLCKECGIVH